MRAAGEPQSARQFHNLQFGQYAVAAARPLRRSEAPGGAHARPVRREPAHDRARRPVARRGRRPALPRFRSGRYGRPSTCSPAATTRSLRAFRPRRAMRSLALLASQAAHAWPRSLATTRRNGSRRDATLARCSHDPPTGGTGRADRSGRRARDARRGRARAPRRRGSVPRDGRGGRARRTRRPRHPQPTFPPIPAHELYGRCLLDAGRSTTQRPRSSDGAEAVSEPRARAARRRPRVARAPATAQPPRATPPAFTAMWSNADAGRPELAEAIAAALRQRRPRYSGGPVNLWFGGALAAVPQERRDFDVVHVDRGDFVELDRFAPSDAGGGLRAVRALAEAGREHGDADLAVADSDRSTRRR